MPGTQTTAAPGSGIKWLYLVVAAAGQIPFAFALPRVAAAGLVGASFVACRLLGLWWLQASWSSVPSGDRQRAGSESSSPEVWRAFIPLYNVFWAFTINVALCRAINAALERMRLPTRAHAALAVAAVIPTALAWRGWSFTGGVGAGVALSWIAYALWFAYMLECDAAKRIMFLGLRVEREASASRTAAAA